MYQVVVEYSEEAVGRKAFEDAQQLIQAALGNGSFDADKAVADLRELDEDERLGPSTGSIVEAAVARAFPTAASPAAAWCSLAGVPSSAASRRPRSIRPAPWLNPSARTKTLTKRLLHAAGVPVPLGKPVETVEEAWEVAQKVGLPVVVKPQDGNQGKGVTVNITDRAQLEEAYKNAAEYGTVMVERFLPGHDFRLLVVGDQLVAAAAANRPRCWAMASTPCANWWMWSTRTPPWRRPRHLAHQDPPR